MDNKKCPALFRFEYEVYFSQIYETLAKEQGRFISAKMRYTAMHLPHRAKNCTSLSEL